MLRSPLRGRPLHILLLVVAGWVGLRVATWSPPQWRTPPVAAMEWPSLALFDRNEGMEAEPEARASEGFERGPVPYAVLPRSGVIGAWPEMPAAYGGTPAGAAIQVAGYAALPPAAYVVPPVQPIRVPVTVPLYYAAHTALGGGYGGGQPALTPAVWLADNGLPPGLPGLATGGTMGRVPGGGAGLTGQSIPDASAPVPLTPGLKEGKADRWSADMWMLARKESPMPLASGRPVYGGSQAGAVLRYHIAPSSGHRPLAYLRATSAMGVVKESEIALGLGARPLASVPVVLAAEARGFRSASGRKSFRPAVLAYTELSPFALPLGLTGEAYVQGGYVAGAYKTAFVDGQLRVDRKVLQIAGTSLRLGGGIWGGMQQGASRLDAGPGASAMVNIWGAPSRVSLDWRFRLLGDAVPISGPALTISSGF